VTGVRDPGAARGVDAEHTHEPMRRRADLLLALILLSSGFCGAVLVFALGEASPLRQPPQPIPLPLALTLLACAAGAAALTLAPRITPREGGGEPWSVYASVGALTLVGFALRAADVNRFGLSNDEALFVFAAGHETFSEALRASLSHFHPPTNFIALHYLLKGSWEPWWIRLPALLGGTLAIWGTYLFVRELFGSLAGILAALFTAFSPNLILLSQVCRNYSPSLPFLLLSLFYLARYLRSGGGGSSMDSPV
jgi:hypothetical protein